MNDTSMMAIFNNPEFGQIRTVAIDGEPWFVAADVCAALDISNTTVATERLDEDERAKLNLGRQGEANIVNEFGFYALVMASRKKNARAFKRWVTHEVLPSIRKTGGYMTPAAQEAITAAVNAAVAAYTSELQDVISEQTKLIVAQQEQLDKLERFTVKIGKNQNRTNYYLLREFGSGTKYGWKSTVTARLKVIEDETSISQHDQLNSVYRYMKRRYGVQWDRHIDLYKRVRGFDTASTLDVVSDSKVLKEQFDKALDELFGRLELSIPEVPEPKLSDDGDDPFDELVARVKKRRAVAQEFRSNRSGPAAV